MIVSAINVKVTNYTNTLGSIKNNSWWTRTDWTLWRLVTAVLTPRAIDIDRI